MIRSKTLNIAVHVILALTWTSGCDERVVEVAREAADRQAAQNQQMGELQKEVARGTRSLVEADAAARQEIVGVHRELQAERQQLGTGWNDLEEERRQLAQMRRTESLVVPMVQAVGAVVLVTMLMGFLWQLLASTRSSDSIDVELSELLIQQMLVDEAQDPEPALSKCLPDYRRKTVPSAHST
jgi:hypothetical protein